MTRSVFTRHLQPGHISGCLLVLIPVIWFLPAITGQVVFALGDAWAYSLPLRMITAELWRQGTVPLWNPYSFGGMPLLASIQPGVLYPLNWLFIVFPPGVAMNTITIITFHLALIGTYCFARTLQMNRTSALVTGICFSFGGFMISHIEMTNYIAAAAWLPWLLLACEKIAGSSKWKAAWLWSVAGAGFIALQCFAGLPQATWQTLLICAPYCLYRLLSFDQQQMPGARMRVFVALSFMAVAGALLSAVQLLPTIELQQQGERAALPYEAFAAFSLTPRFLLSLIFPYFYGGGHPPLYGVGGWDHWWLLKYGYGYFSITGVQLLCAAWLGAARVKTGRVLLRYRTAVKQGDDSQAQTDEADTTTDRAGSRAIWFWTLIAAISLCLCLGDNLPFGFNHWLYRLPVFNLFRGSYRHMLEFTFAAAVLAGLGLHQLTQAPAEQARQLWRNSSILLSAVVGVTTLLYLSAARLFAASYFPAPEQLRLSNPEAFVPLLLTLSSLLVLRCNLHRRTGAQVLLVTVLLLDLASFGWFTYWRTTDAGILRQLADSEATQAVKTLEPDPAAFRIISQATWPYGENYAAISHANMAGARGLQSVSGYDPLRLPLAATLAGAMDIFGTLRDQTVFAPASQSLNLLNVKYLIRERSSAGDELLQRRVNGDQTEYQGILSELQLKPGARIELEADSFKADTLTIISTAFGVAGLADGTPLVRLRLHGRNGGVIERALQIGRDTAEWAYDRADINARIRHRRAQIAQSWRADSQQGSFSAHRYLASFSFAPDTIEFLELQFIQPEAALAILRARLSDSSSQAEMPLDRLRLSPQRWRLAGRYQQADLYENLQVMPRAWFVNNLKSMSAAEALETISSGKFADGQAFDPTDVALLTEQIEQAAAVGPGKSGGRAKVTGWEPHRIRLQTQNSLTQMLLLSEIYYPGWEAAIDGKPTRIHRADYALRGVMVPAGEHQVELRYRPASLRYGVLAALAGIGLLLAAGFCVRISVRRGSITGRDGNTDKQDSQRRNM